MYNQNYSSPNQPTTDLFVEEPLVYSSFWSRFGAALIDGVILFVINLMWGLLTSTDMGNLLSILTAWLYSAILESGSGQATLGKKAVGIKVVNAEGKRISFGQATGRHFGKILSTLILFIGYLMMLWDEKKQTLHDKMANTYVVND